MAPSSRTRGVKIRHPGQRRGEQQGKGPGRIGAAVPPFQYSKTSSTRTCLFRCFSCILIAAIIVLIPVTVFLHEHPKALKAIIDTASNGGLPAGWHLLREALSRTSKNQSASLLPAGTQLGDTAAQAVANDTSSLPFVDTSLSSESSPDMKIKPFRSSLNVLLASGARILPSKAGELAREPPAPAAASKPETVSDVSVSDGSKGKSKEEKARKAAKEQQRREKRERRERRAKKERERARRRKKQQSSSLTPATQARKLLESRQEGEPGRQQQQHPAAEVAQAMLAGGIPGTRISTADEARAYRQRLQCMSSQGQWELDPTPRLLPWPSDRGNYGHCDERWQWTSGGGLAFDAANEAVLNGTLKGNPSLWNVRPSLKYEWRTDEQRCGKGQFRPFDGRAMAHGLLGTRDGQGQAPGIGLSSAGQRHSAGARQTSRRLLAADWQAQRPAKSSNSMNRRALSDQGGGLRAQRVVLLVGDSMQHSFAQSLLDNMNLGVGREHAATTVLPSDSLPCAVKKLSHRKVCWGAHFFTRTQPGVRLMFIRNDFLSLRESPDWSRDGKHFEVPWIPTLRLLSQGGVGMAWAESGGEEQGRGGEAGSEGPTGGRWLPPVVVLNKGLHYAPDEDFFPSLNASMRAARAACPACVIVFRNTPGGHKGCNHITQPLVRRPTAAEQPFNWHAIVQQTRDPRTRALVEAVGALFMDVESATTMRGDGHTGKNRSGKEDCAHYCAPGPVDFWSRLLHHILAEILLKS